MIELNREKVSVSARDGVIINRHVPVNGAANATVPFRALASGPFVVGGVRRVETGCILRCHLSQVKRSHRKPERESPDGVLIRKGLFWKWPMDGWLLVDSRSKLMQESSRRVSWWLAQWRFMTSNLHRSIVFIRDSVLLVVKSWQKFQR